jgi:divalent metal cation (Fe/Co/Zn/Cd) transporter
MDAQEIAARKEADLLLLKWERRTMLAVFSHARSANRCASWDIRLGAASVILTAIVGTSVFATLQIDPGNAVRVGVGVLTVAAAVSSAVHVFAGLTDRKATYEQASRRHAAIRRRIEVVRARLATTEQSSSIWDEVEGIKKEMDSAAASSPNAAGRVWEQVKRQMKGEFTWWERLRAKALGVPLSQVGLLPSIDSPRDTLEDRAGPSS